jgi:pilus assembly protein CpaF
MEEILSVVQSYLLDRGIETPPWRSTQKERARFTSRVAQALVELGYEVGESSEIARKIAPMMVGLGVLEQYLDSEERWVEEIIVRRNTKSGMGHVMVERRGKIYDIGDLASDEYFEERARKAAELGGRLLKASQPFVLVDLPDGSRLTAMIPPLSVNGTAINIRVFRTDVLTFEDLLETGTFELRGEEERRKEETIELGNPVATFLATIASRAAASIVISGAFSAGKTTLLNAMSLFFPERLQLAVIETFQELILAHPYPARAVVPVEEREGFPNMREVVNIVYTRMRPDVIIVGEIVGEEAIPFVDAINLGRKAMTTIHGGGPVDALHRLEILAIREGVPLLAVRERVARGVDLVVHMERDSLGRRYVAEIARVLGLEDGGYRLEVLYSASAREGERVFEALRRAMDEVFVCY